MFIFGLHVIIGKKVQEMYTEKAICLKDAFVVQVICWLEWLAVL